MGIGTMEWVVVIVALVTVCGLVFWLVDMYSKGRMMRCPETGSIALIRVALAASGEGKSPKVTVKQCDLWPEKRDCAQGCLARYSETTPGYRVNPNSLRPFGPQ